MQRFLAAFLTLAAAMVLPLAAHADPMDELVLTGGGQTLTSSVPVTSAFPDFDHFGDFGEGGIEFYPEGFILVAPTISFGSGFNLIGPQPYSLSFVPASNPYPYFSEDVVVTFIPGTYDYQSVDMYLEPLSPPVFYTLTITPETTTATTPEPSSLILLSTGIFGLLGLATLKRRRIAFFH